MNVYLYALTVDWDQKDQAAYYAITDELFSALSDLIASERLTVVKVLARSEVENA